MIRAQLHITGPGINRLFVLEEGVTRIGSSFDCDIWLDHPLVSAEHLSIIWAEQAATLIAFQNNRGTRLNGQLVVSEDPRPLNSGDVVLVHPYTMAFTIVNIKIGSSSSAVDHEEEDLRQVEFPTAAEEALDLSMVPDALVGGRLDQNLEDEVPPGLGNHSIRYINYLPEIYKSDFVSRFLAMLESVLMPVEWTIDNIDLMLDPDTTVKSFLPWLAQWFGVTFDATWSEEKQRLFLKDAHQLYAMRGTKWAMARTLSIYTGQEVEIVDLDDDDNPFLFKVRFPCRENEIERVLVEKMIEIDKPAHTIFQLEFTGTPRIKTEDRAGVLDH